MVLDVIPLVCSLHCAVSRPSQLKVSSSLSVAQNYVVGPATHYFTMSAENEIETSNALRHLFESIPKEH
jgi:hypothetical protein